MSDPNKTNQYPQDYPQGGDFPPPPSGPPPPQSQPQYQAFNPTQSTDAYAHQAAACTGEPSIDPRTPIVEAPSSPVGYPDEKRQHGQETVLPTPPPPPATDNTTSQFSGVDTQQHFPPPPPQVPPPQQHADWKPPADNYSIPAYNPANPVFAPPPPDLDTTTAHQDASHLSAVTPEQSPGGHAHGHQKKPSWGERFTQIGMKAAAPINSLAHKLGSQSFLPEPMDKECEKAAAILQAFCKKGVYADSQTAPTSTDPQAAQSSNDIIDPTKEAPKNRVLVTIPPKVISRAVGLAIFTTLRAGFQVSGATGSGILIARLPDGTWSAPSGITVHAVGGGFLVGLDVYDCVCVINSREALEAFTNTRVSLGSDLAVVAGPYGAGGAVGVGTTWDGKKKKTTTPGSTASETLPATGETLPGATPIETSAEPLAGQTLQPPSGAEGKPTGSKIRSLSANRLKPVFSYVKSRGFYAGVQIDGTVIIERKDANAAFYGDRVSVSQILHGQLPAATSSSSHVGQGASGAMVLPPSVLALQDVLKGAEAGQLKDTVTGAGQGMGVGVAGDRDGEEGLPAYVDDRVQRPDVGDYKYS